MPFPLLDQCFHHTSSLKALQHVLPAIKISKPNGTHEVKEWMTFCCLINITLVKINILHSVNNQQ